jgi:prophage regulatory protein
MNGEHKTGAGAAEHGVPDRLLRLPAVLAAVGLGRTAVLDRVKAGSFPQGHKVGRATLWSERAVQSWIAAQVAANRGRQGEGGGK